MVGDDRPTAPPLVSPSDEGDPFGGLQSGTQVGKYEIAEMLGQGGFGITYRARDTQLRRDVAIKEYLPTSFAVRRGGTMVLPRSTQTAEDFLWGRERFLDEARTLARLEDAPGIVNVYDFMEANGTAYMVMALVRGETLEARLKRDRRLQQPAIEQLLYPLLDGLELVHEAGFLHRDIKPANILLDASGRPTLIDFGASRVALQGRTQALTAVYTPGYAAFEQSTSAKQGPWTDIYALAATLYHCVTSAPPPAASDRMIDDRMLAAIEAGKGRYAPSLLAAIDSGLKLKPGERPQTIGNWRRVLSGLAAASGGESLGRPTREMDEPATRRMPEPTARRRAPLAWVAAGIVAVALAGGGAWIVLKPEPDTVEVAVRRAEAEAQRQAALAARLRQEEDARLRAAAEARRQTEAEASRKAAEEKQAAEDAARRQAEEAERVRQAAAAAQRKADEDAARKAAEEKAAADAAAKRQAEEAERQRQAAAVAQRKADEDAARKAAEERAPAEAAARRRAEEEAAARAEANAARQRREDEIRREAEARVRAEYEARRRAEEEARAKSEAEATARRREEEAARAEAAAREKAEAEAKRKADADARQAADDKIRAEADAKRQAEAAEAALRLSETDRKRIQVALTALGHNTQGSDGSFGARTRQMIAAWQKSQGAPETGYLTSIQFAALRQQAAPALARFDDEQKKIDDEKRKTEEEAKRKAEEEAKKRAEEERRQQQKPAAAGPSVAAAPSTTSPATGVDGTWSGAMDCENGPKPKLTFQVAGGSGRTNFTTRTGQGDMSLRISGDSVSVQLSWPGREGNTMMGSLRGTVSGPRLTASGNSRAGSGGTPTLCSLTLSR